MTQELEHALTSLICRADMTLVSSVDPEGFPITKAMLPPREREGVRVFWFSTNTSSQKVQAFRQNPKASLYFVDRAAFCGASFTGTMEVLEDPAAKERLWQQGDTLFYPTGVTDPDYCVLRFTAIRGRYYSDLHSQDFSL